MREIPSNDNGYPERVLPSTSTSISTTPPLERQSPPSPHGRSNSASSIPNISTVRHRLLPQTPAYHTRRSSSPRFLPTPPPSLLSSTAATAASNCSLHNFEQRLTGRRLPQTPIRKLSTGLIAAINSASIRRYSNTANNDAVGSSTNSSNTTGKTGDNEWPSPTVVQRKFSELEKASQSDIYSASELFEHFTCGTPLRPLQRLPFLKQQQQHRYQQQGGKFNQSKHSLNHSSSTSTTTNAFSRNSSVPPSVEQVEINSFSFIV